MLTDAPHLIEAWNAALASGGVVLASSRSESDNTFYLLLLGPISGIGFYTMTYLRYRNTDKRYKFEHETHSEAVDVRAFDRKVGERTQTTDTRVQGDNSRKPLQRLGQGTRIRRAQD